MHEKNNDCTLTRFQAIRLNISKHSCTKKSWTARKLISWPFDSLLKSSNYTDISLFELFFFFFFCSFLLWPTKHMFVQVCSVRKSGRFQHFEAHQFQTNPPETSRVFARVTWTERRSYYKDEQSYSVSTFLSNCIATLDHVLEDETFCRYSEWRPSSRIERMHPRSFTVRPTRSLSLFLASSFEHAFVNIIISINININIRSKTKDHVHHDNHRCHLELFSWPSRVCSICSFSILLFRFRLLLLLCQPTRAPAPSAVFVRTGCTRRLLLSAAPCLRFRLRQVAPIFVRLFKWSLSSSYSSFWSAELSFTFASDLVTFVVRSVRVSPVSQLVHLFAVLVGQSTQQPLVSSSSSSTALVSSQVRHFDPVPPLSCQLVFVCHNRPALQHPPSSFHSRSLAALIIRLFFLIATFSPFSCSASFPICSYYFNFCNCDS